MGVEYLVGLPLYPTYFFTDDCFIYFRANETKAHNVRQILLEYGVAMGKMWVPWAGSNCSS